MTFEQNIPNIPAGFNGGQEFAVNALNPILFSQIFNGVPQLYAGSSFTVEEVIEIGTLVNSPELIDTDFRWYPPKQYLGTWTLFDQVSAFGTYPEDRGFIEDTITKIRRYSTYVIQANANVPIAVHEQSAIDGCNFQLISVQVGSPPLQVEGSALFDPVAVLKSRNTLTRVPLIDQPFNSRIRTIGLHIDPGAELTSINYKCRVINAISVDLPEFPITLCFYAPPSNCPLLFATFVSNGLVSAVDGLIYTTQAAAEAARLLLPVLPATVVYPGNYTCPVAPGTIYDYWFIGYGSGGSGG